ncbi:MAG TPA: uridine phosphorylase [bacterium]|nr:uridine phosphorylase [bacterium]HPQ66523.1 uridine phosphorylase [bacterium]
MGKIYHIQLDRKMIGGAKLAVVPGDPGRVPKIAGQLSPRFRELAFNREYRSCLVPVGSREKVLVTSTGIGGPSATIAVEELAMLGITTFVRLGTTGSIRKDLKVGDVVVTAAAVRLDGSSTHYAPIEYPAAADFFVTRILVEAAEKAGIPFRVGVTASSDTFYPGQERYDSHGKYVIRKFQGTLGEWQRLGVLNYEMESSALFTTARALGLRAGCVAGVIVNRASTEAIRKTDVARAEDNTISVLKDSLGPLLALARSRVRG